MLVAPTRLSKQKVKLSDRGLSPSKHRAPGLSKRPHRSRSEKENHLHVNELQAIQAEK